MSFYSQRFTRTTFVLFGAILITLSLLRANYASLSLLMVLWLMAGFGQNCVNLPTQTLIADRIPRDAQGRVYGAHFAWSHLWWAISYPLAGWLGSKFPEGEFLYSSLVGLALLVVVQLTLKPPVDEYEHVHENMWHEHSHIHDEHHQHNYHQEILESEPHTHPHQHRLTRHSHSYFIDIHHPTR
ncbi:MFS transporter [Nostoc sp. C052]|uniref:MFS transporter n=1 Tax=Nostoc sp. C052 TaxID=2576902 RepID=UPI002117C8EF|nr:MFS transporter [Nostoc sp. C052]